MHYSQISGFIRSTMLVVLTCATGTETLAQLPADEPLTLQARTRVEVEPGIDRWHSLVNRVTWKPSETCIVVCDMWDDHWCKPAAARVAEMAPKMNDVIRTARDKGVFIIHCPSDTMGFYKDFPQRKLAQAAPVAETEIPLERWCYLDKTREGERLPIDDSDGGCDCDPPPKNYRAWSRQHPAIEIAEQDAVTDSSEAFYLMKQRAIQNVIVMGVHTNMCVLGRPFSIRQMVRQGQNVVLMRDMTDTMYNPAMAPFVSHFTGNDLVVQHIEQYWCPTITSTDFAVAEPFRFGADKRKHIVIIASEPEYRTEVSLTQFAKEELGKDFKVSLVYGDAENGDLLPGLEVLKSADLAVISVRRRTLLPDQMQLIREFIDSGKPVIGIRTASHAFCLRNKPAPDDRADWPEFDRDVIGGSYTSHHGAGPKTSISLAAGNEEHPILHGINVTELRGCGSLYKSSPLQPTAAPLLIGTIPDESAEPVAWINRRKDGGTTFYTSLGHVGDFEQPGFRRLLSNACTWLAQQPAP